MPLLSSMKNVCIRIEATRAFTVTSWAVVLASCISVVLFDPTDRHCVTTACKQLIVWHTVAFISLFSRPIDMSADLLGPVHRRGPGPRDSSWPARLRQQQLEPLRHLRFVHGVCTFQPGLLAEC